jgi:hypothetical protein
VDELHKVTGGRGMWWHVARTVVQAALALTLLGGGVLADLADDLYRAVDGPDGPPEYIIEHHDEPILLGGEVTLPVS